jgi:Icc-related predicted phosphoesterase
MSREFLENALTVPFDGITIVMTHHAPSLRGVPVGSHWRQVYEDVLACYASDYDALIERFQPALWAHGHFHFSSDYFIGRTRVVCNPRGYSPDHLNLDFDPMIVIEIG